MPGVCKLGDQSKAPIDAHGCPFCPHHNVIGPAISASSNVFINMTPALRIDDIGMHAACCGTNMWEVTGASAQVFVNGSAMVRLGDPTLHCGGVGKMVTASGNVTDGSPMATKGAFAFPAQKALPLNEVMLFPSEENVCLPADNRGGVVETPGLPVTGGPQIYNAQAAEAQHEASLPHAEAAPSPSVQAAGERKLAARYWLAGNDAGYNQATNEANHLDGESQLQVAEQGLQALINAGKAQGEALKKAQENVRIARAAENNPSNVSGQGDGGEDEDAP
jgi:uncharacterized Zn-binding protein involved in type VI secretion